MFGDDRASFMFQSREERKVGVRAAGVVERFGLRIAKGRRRGWVGAGMWLDLRRKEIGKMGH